MEYNVFTVLYFGDGEVVAALNDDIVAKDHAYVVHPNEQLKRMVGNKPFVLQVGRFVDKDIDYPDLEKFTKLSQLDGMYILDVKN